MTAITIDYVITILAVPLVADGISWLYRLIQKVHILALRYLFIDTKITFCSINIIKYHILIIFKKNKSKF